MKTKGFSGMTVDGKNQALIDRISDDFNKWMAENPNLSTYGSPVVESRASGSSYFHYTITVFYEEKM